MISANEDDGAGYNVPISTRPAPDHNMVVDGSSFSFGQSGISSGGTVFMGIFP
jgi:hypothetical protein